MHVLMTLLTVTALTARLLGSEPTPHVAHAGLVAPHILGMTIIDGTVLPAAQVPYVAQAGDVIGDDPGGNQSPTLHRADGTLAGWLTLDHRHLRPVPRVVGQLTDRGWLDAPTSYTITASDDARFRSGSHPQQVSRKAKPIDAARIGGWKFDVSLRHTVYLHLDAPWQPGTVYRIAFAGNHLPPLTVTPADDVVSEAIHVTALGFRPQDEPKVAFYSCWLGTGGALIHETAPDFVIRKIGDGSVVQRGTAERIHQPGRIECERNRDHTLTEVYRLDFSAVQSPGSYRIEIPGVGASPAFRIDDGVWREALTLSARGQFHLRSGNALGAPHTTVVRPRSFHPDDGVIVRQSTTPIMDSGNGLNARGTDKGNFTNLVAGATDTVVPEAWGGHYDAGDWDRRIQHLVAARLLIDLLLENGPAAERLTLNLPETGNGLPDLLNEALWGIDCYRRMMTPEGGVRGGIESADHPRHAEGGWQESHAIFAYAPDVWSSYLYAATAARAAFWLEGKGLTAQAGPYRESALRAMSWAEITLPTLDYPQPINAVRDARNLAAADVFRLTGEARWHELFVATTLAPSISSQAQWKSHNQADAIWTYLTTERPGRDEALLARCRELLLTDAATAIRLQGRRAFGWTHRDPWHWVGWGNLSTPQAIDLVRAWRLTGEAHYRQAAVLATQLTMGANPDNLAYTTGMGERAVSHAFFQDTEVLAQPPPPGITVYGPADLANNADYWALKLMAPWFTPEPKAWPTTESLLQVTFCHMMMEFTLQDSLAPTTYVFGSLAF